MHIEHAKVVKQPAIDEVLHFCWTVNAPLTFVKARDVWFGKPDRLADAPQETTGDM